MSDEKQKKIFSKNLSFYLEKSGKSQKEVAKAIGVIPQTFNTWCTGQSIPRMGSVQALADYFGIGKSDLIEEKNENESIYYLNDETREIAQEIYENPDLRILFDASKNASPEDLKFVIEMVKRMKGDD